MNDTYEKGGECITTLFSLDGLMASLQEPYKNLHPENKTERQCTHTDGAIKVAEYILSEIKANVRSDTAETIRYLIDEDFIIKRLTEWNKLPFYARLGPPPKADLLAAMAIWYQTVKTGSIWDHKPKIRDFFSSVAVARPLPRKENHQSLIIISLNSMIIFMMFGQTYIMVMLDVVSVFLKQFS